MSDNEWTKVGDSFEKRDVIDLKREGIGTVTQGLYESKKEHVGANDSTVYNITVDGEKVFFWGSAVLDARFQEIPANSEVRIVFKGLQAPKVAGRSKTNVYDVFYREAGTDTDQETKDEDTDDIPF